VSLVRFHAHGERPGHRIVEPMPQVFGVSLYFSKYWIVVKLLDIWLQIMRVAATIKARVNDI
jgi:hypothetical protein